MPARNDCYIQIDCVCCPLPLSAHLCWFTSYCTSEDFIKLPDQVTNPIGFYCYQSLQTWLKVSSHLHLSNQKA